MTRPDALLKRLLAALFGLGCALLLVPLRWLIPALWYALTVRGRR